MKINRKESGAAAAEQNQGEDDATLDQAPGALLGQEKQPTKAVRGPVGSSGEGTVCSFSVGHRTQKDSSEGGGLPGPQARGSLGAGKPRKYVLPEASRGNQPC